MRVAVLASGTGTNLQALLEQVHGREGIEIVAVGSDKPDAGALGRARAAGVPAGVFELSAYADRQGRDRAMAAWLRERDAELVVLAGYMQLLSPEFLAAFSGHVINVHPALLPAFPGLAAVEQALAYGVKVFGVTVHFVDDGVDSGPVILQRATDLPDARDPQEVRERLHPIEHELLPEAVRLIARGAVKLDPTNPRRVVIERYSRVAMEQGTERVSAFAPTLPGEVQVTRALLSVSDKRGIVEFARGLAELGIEIISTGGTAGALTEAGLPVRSISELTGFPEIMDGRVKTLHPKLYAGLLAVRDELSHMQAAQEHDVEFVDLVCVNLYPFERTASQRGVDDHEVIENIDIGGPTMIRAAAKNHAFAAPVVSPESYDAVLAELRESDRRLSASTRENLAAEAFAYTARYDTAIARWFQEKREDFPPLLVRAFEKVLELPYGENPHQRAAYYAQVGSRTHVLSMVSQLGGKQLSFNNLLDLDSGRLLLAEFQIPACVIIKHNNPCGVAVGTTPLEAYLRAFACDPMSAFGGVICLNRQVDRPLAEALIDQFVEVLFARGYTHEALDILASKPNTRILDDRERRTANMIDPHLRQVVGGMLVQDRDFDFEDRAEMQVVSERHPTEAEWGELSFAWKVCKHVKSNAIVLAKDLATVGVGAGQMSRVDSVRLAIEKSQTSLEGASMASDAYFPFSDGPQLGLDAGVTAIIQPGGSVRDAQTVEAVDAAGAAMVFTSRRHFRH
ncbi:MAG: bifunctional phosphoribosylaminoimidazolecarboxamide formyltransferase/IMP cyclohydrolase [Solirubrobacteraceae bacterium]